MRSRKVGALPVVAEGELVGIITESDIFKAFASLLTGGENPVRVTFDGLDEGLEQFAESVAQAARGSGMILASLISFEWKGRQRAVARAVGRTRKISFRPLKWWIPCSKHPEGIVLINCWIRYQ